MPNAWFETVAIAQQRAKRRLPQSVYGALVAGSERGQTLEDNVAAFTFPAAMRPRGDGVRLGTNRGTRWA
jgi:hypothetical protein